MSKQANASTGEYYQQTGSNSMPSFYLKFWIYLALPALASANLQAASERPNVLFIAADDLRNTLGCYGDPVVKTPNLDRLAARGRLFERAYCQQALCNPSRASLLTGLRPDTLKVWNLTTHFRETIPDVVTLPQHFKNNGYFTQNIGKIFHNYRTKIEGDPDSWSVPATMHFGSHGDDRAVMPAGSESPASAIKIPGAEARDVPDEAYLDGRVAAAAVAALQDLAEQQRPFFLAVGFWKPHSPFNAPKRYWDLYRPENIPAAAPDAPSVGVPRIALHEALEGLGGKNAALLRWGYYAAISYLDAQVGRVLDALDRTGLSENTIVVFWSDHGLHLGEQGLWGKTSNFELDARMPLMMAVPNMLHSGVKTRALVEALDLYPTLVDLCALPAVPGLEGRTLRAILANPEAQGASAAFTQHPRPSHIGQVRPSAVGAGGASSRANPIPPIAMGYSIRTDRFRYTEWRIWGTGQVVGMELYDHLSDTTEHKNLTGDPAFITEQTSLAGQLARQFPPHGLRLP